MNEAHRFLLKVRYGSFLTPIIEGLIDLAFGIAVVLAFLGAAFLVFGPLAYGIETSNVYIVGAYILVALFALFISVGRDQRRR